MTRVEVTCVCSNKVDAILKPDYGTDGYRKTVVECTKCGRRMLIRAKTEISGEIEAYLVDPEEME